MLAAFCVLGIAGCNEAKNSPAPAPSTNASTASSSDRDNTGVNVRDRNDAAKTPFDQKENQADIKITADIRKRVVDSEMSTDAKNVKIITENGRVTLRGPVKSADEKAKIKSIAGEIAGSDKVDDQLEIAGGR